MLLSPGAFRVSRADAVVNAPAPRPDPFAPAAQARALRSYTAPQPTYIRAVSRRDCARRVSGQGGTLEHQPEHQGEAANHLRNMANSTHWNGGTLERSRARVCACTRARFVPRVRMHATDSTVPPFHRSNGEVLSIISFRCDGTSTGTEACATVPLEQRRLKTGVIRAEPGRSPGFRGVRCVCAAARARAGAGTTAGARPRGAGAWPVGRRTCDPSKINDVELKSRASRTAACRMSGAGPANTGVSGDRSADGRSVAARAFPTPPPPSSRARGRPGVPPENRARPSLPGVPPHRGHRFELAKGARNERSEAWVGVRV